MDYQKDIKVKSIIKDEGISLEENEKLDYSYSTLSAVFGKFFSYAGKRSIFAKLPKKYSAFFL